jgi:hypothetical protein
VGSIEVQKQYSKEYYPPINIPLINCDSISTANMSITQQSIIGDMRNHAFPYIYSSDWKINIDWLKKKYTFIYPEMVNAFLQQYPFLINILKEANTYIEKHFYNNPKVLLKISKDPESEDDFEQLFAYIITDLPVMDAITRLSHLDHDWYLKQPQSVRNIFNINI